jgi:hypothetical protein
MHDRMISLREGPLYEFNSATLYLKYLYLYQTSKVNGHVCVLVVSVR